MLELEYVTFFWLKYVTSVFLLFQFGPLLRRGRTCLPARSRFLDQRVVWLSPGDCGKIVLRYIELLLGNQV